ncbi:MAG: EAL domain-containing protein [Chloroflexota bacterium]
MALRRNITIAIYFVATGVLPLYYLAGFRIGEIIAVAIVSWVTTGVSIIFAFDQIIKGRRRSAYPSMLLLRLGDTITPPDAARQALFILEGLLLTKASFISLKYNQTFRILATRGISAGESQWVMSTHTRVMEDCLDKRFPVEVMTDAPGRRAVFVPIVALRQMIGVLYLVSSEKDELADRSLLADIGIAVGLSLENLRQKEQLAQKESRLRSVVMGAPIVLFSIDTTGAITFIQGKGIAGLNLPPENVIGLTVWQIWEQYPEIIHSFKRAFAGDQVTSLASITLTGVPMTFEYRLAPERDEQGRVTGVICIATDMTQRKRAEDALRESERALATLLHNLPGFAYRTRLDWTLEFVSDGIFDVTGYTAADLMAGKSHASDFINPDEIVRINQVLADAIDHRQPYAMEYQIKSADGETKWVWDQGQPILAEDSGEVVALEGYISDVTERKNAEALRDESEMRLRDLFENARDALFSYDLKSGRVLTGNTRAVEITGYTRDEFLKTSVYQLVPVEWHTVGAEAIKRTYAGDSTPYELEITAKDGSRVPLEITCRILPDETGAPRIVQAIARDVSERKQAEEMIRRLAYHDALTDLPNRALFEDRLQLALAQARRTNESLAVMFLDLDSFKVVNDTLGHGAGDKLLQAVGRDLATLVREGDTVARVGGDEFTLLLTGINSPQDAIDVASRILDSLRQTRMINSTEFRTTGSIGITTYPADGDDGETLLRNADTAMYRAKERGRDMYQMYTASMNARMMERIAVEQDLRHALARGELSLAYQPIVSVETGAVTGAEVLLRWTHPVRGVVTPDEFIPLAEETGLIVEIGEWVLRNACRQVIEWRDSGLKIDRIAVNISARQLQQEDLVERITQILGEVNIPPELLQLEITEGAVMKNVDHANAMLRRLAHMGIEVALDDFGTGYSSLTYLKRFPIDAVKIDRSFVRDLEHDASDATIVSTVIAMADNLHLNVIAEGVETEAQLQFLRERGCAEYQGYLFSGPVTADEFATFVRKARADAVIPEVA